MSDAKGELDHELTADELAAIEEKYDEATHSRAVTPTVGKVLQAVAVVFAAYHFLTAGFGLPVDYWHMGLHLTGLFIMTYALFPFVRTESAMTLKPSPFRIGNIPIFDLILMALGIASALYLGLAWRGIDFLGIAEQTFRQGNPNNYDIFFGTVLIVLVLDLARRTLGWVLPLIICIFMTYALFGQFFPGILNHPGVNWRQFVNNMYFPAEGIFGVTLWVVSTIVFHFVLFGVIAQRMGLGQFFIDIAQIVAGRFSGGPAKVSVLASSLFGTISGSSIANTVTTGSLTIPAMKRIGYPGHFAGAVEAASSTGGQITPPIMGAAAFLMVEFLEIPYTTIIVAAAIPALMHYVAVFAIVHFEAKRLGLRGLDPAEIPCFWTVLRRGWPTMIPLVILISVLFSGYTAYYAAFWGITSCIVIGFLSRHNRLTLKDLLDAFYMGSKYALAVGAAGAAVGIVVGVITLTGVTFRLGFMVTQGALTAAEFFHAAVAFLPFELFTIDDATLFISLIYIAMACVLMGAGLPTTALYIMLSAIAAPALGNLGVPALAAHLFVLYYGVLADITPPVCTSAYAAGGIAGANPFRTGLTAFKLGNAKVMVPIVFAYSPAMLLVIEEHFSWGEFLHVTTTCILGIVMLGAALTGYMLCVMSWPWRALLGVGAVMMVAPSVQANLWAALVAAPVLVAQILGWRRQRDAVHS